MERCIDLVATRLQAAELYFGHGSDNAHDEAAWLVMCAAGIDVGAPEIDWRQTLSSDQVQAATNLASQRISTRKPLAYLLGHAWFAGHRFNVDPRVIVPRSHFGEWIPQQLQPWLDPTNVLWALDLCTGSGCIAIALAKAFPAARVDATELSAAALEVAHNNVKLHGVTERVKLFEGDLFGPLDGRRYDLIVCNPPYVDAPTMARLPLEYRHEPTIAFAGGAHGMALVQRLIAEAEPYLNPGGSLLVEVGPAAANVEASWKSVPFTWLISSAGEPVIFLLSKQDLTDHRGALAVSGKR